jgi:hypothetical protein
VKPCDGWVTYPRSYNASMKRTCKICALEEVNFGIRIYREQEEDEEKHEGKIRERGSKRRKKEEGEKK